MALNPLPDLNNDYQGRPLLRAAISAASSGDNTVVAAVAGKKIRVLSMYLRTITAVAVRFESAAGGTALSGVMSFGATDDMVLPYNEDGWLETLAGELLNLELGGNIQTSGFVTYVLM